MTDNQKHAARLREMAELWVNKANKPALLAGAKALEGHGRWRLLRHFGQSYLIPVERCKEWIDWCENREQGEHTSIVPAWAVSVPENVVITGVELL